MRDTLLTFMIGGVLLVGCAGQVPPELRDARAAYERAAEEPATKRKTPAELYEAQKALASAERTFDEQGDTADTRDRAYVAMRKAELASVLARTAEHHERIAAAESASRQAREQDAAKTRQELARTRADLATEQAESALTQEQLEAERARRAEAERRAAQAVAALGQVAAVKQDKRGTVVTLSGSVLFTSGKSALLPAAESRLRQVADALLGGDPDATFVVEGHTDSTGDPGLNQRLSEERARAVRDYLVAQGLPADRVEARGLGSTQPVADNSTAEGRANNRRVEIIIRPAAA